MIDLLMSARVEIFDDILDRVEVGDPRMEC